jgi:hypothetical protein
MNVQVVERAGRALPESATFMLLLQHFGRMLGAHMTLFDGKYDFLSAGGDRNYLELPDNIIKNEYKEIAKPFRAGLDRLTSLFELPLQLIFWSGRLAVVKFLGRYRCGLDPQDASQDDEPQINAAILQAYNEATAEEGVAVLAYSARSLGFFLGDDGDHGGIVPACEGVEAMLAAMVMGAYAAFETLAADLWVAAVNCHPTLATNWLEKNQDKQIPGSVLAGYGFNTSGCMGTVLHDTKKVTFESLFDVKKHYALAFKGAVDDVFDHIDDLRMAEKTRHLFAHRGGLIDQKFKEQMKDYPEYAGATVGERLRLIGPVAGHHVTACARSGVALLKAVDTWSLSQS